MGRDSKDVERILDLERIWERILSGDLERILDLGRIWERILRIWKGFLIWTGFGKGFWGFGKDS